MRTERGQLTGADSSPGDRLMDLWVPCSWQILFCGGRRFDVVVSLLFSMLAYNII